MTPLFPVTDLDRRIYEENIRDFMPDRIVDIHTHIWLKEHKANSDPGRVVKWPGKVADISTIEDLKETYTLMFPGKKVVPLIFGNPTGIQSKNDKMNDYVRDCAAANNYPALICSTPEWSAKEFEDRIARGGFLGAKVYLTFAPSYIPEKEIRVFDFIPPHQLEVLNRRGWILMLHIPRDGRLKDPVNIAQMLEIDSSFSRCRTIIAHVGRAYCPEDVGDAFEQLAPARSLMYDICANTNAENFTALLRAVGPQRVLFGSDLPILRMRTRRICESGFYVNLVPRGLYGDVSYDRHMREVDGAEAAALTFFMYEEILAFKKASENVGLSKADVADVFHGNAERLFNSITTAKQ